MSISMHLAYIEYAVNHNFVFEKPKCINFVYFILFLSVMLYLSVSLSNKNNALIIITYM